PVILNRLAMSSFLRQEEHALFYSMAALDHWQSLGSRVINGPGVLAYDTNKARQLSLFRQAGLDIPPTRVAHRREDVVRLAADVGMVDKPTITISEFKPSAEIVRAVERVAVMSGLDVGGIEYMVDDRDGRPKFYDLNAMSNFVAKPLEVLGWDPHERLVDWLL